MHNLIPPKFTPTIFEEVGRALGPSLLDLTNSNPRSRVPNSEYRSLQGLRNALRHEINRGLSKARVSKVRVHDDGVVGESLNDVAENFGKFGIDEWC